ncbi:MAG: PTS sugar transporter subunit IIB [Erysipelotrichaceae bacterium]|nr:PTS sugar transporter subunit IIB [Erysipelotrichaceae bacterium]
MANPRIQAVCGFGCGSSLMLRMKIDSILKQHGLEAFTFTGDVGTCLANECDVIFISNELAERIADRARVPIVVINNFMNTKEVEQKVLDYYKTLEQ